MPVRIHLDHYTFIVLCFSVFKQFSLGTVVSVILVQVVESDLYLCSVDKALV